MKSISVAAREKMTGLVQRVDVAHKSPLIVNLIISSRIVTYIPPQYIHRLRFNHIDLHVASRACFWFCFWLCSCLLASFLDVLSNIFVESGSWRLSSLYVRWESREFHSLTIKYSPHIHNIQPAHSSDATDKWHRYDKLENICCHRKVYCYRGAHNCVWCIKFQMIWGHSVHKCMSDCTIYTHYCCI